MKNWFTKLLKSEKRPLAINQEDTSFHLTISENKEDAQEAVQEDAQEDVQEVAQEDANSVSSSPSIPIEVEIPSADSYDKETRILFEAFKKLTPVYSFFISEMRNLLNTNTQKMIFHSLSTGLNINQVATHLGIPVEEVCRIYKEAIEDIHTQSASFKELLAGRISIQHEIDALKTKLQIQNDQILALKRANICLLKIRQISKEPNPEQKAQLSVPLQQYLNLDKRTSNAFRMLELNTLEDLLNYLKIHGLNSLKDVKNFGTTSLNRLKAELIENGIFEEDGHCELYDYITTSKPITPTKTKRNRP